MTHRWSHVVGPKPNFVFLCQVFEHVREHGVILGCRVRWEVSGGDLNVEGYVSGGVLNVEGNASDVD